jgi:hypothetical protein
MVVAKGLFRQRNVHAPPIGGQRNNKPRNLRVLTP